MLVLALATLAGCEPVDRAVCLPEDAGIDAVACDTRVVLGPVNVPTYYSGLAGGGQPCSWIGRPYALRVSFFQPGGGRYPIERGLVIEREATCDTTTDYLDLGNVEPGEYDVTVESIEANAAGYHTLLGADLVRPDCHEADGRRGYHCRPIRLRARV